jgi:hypothetical protein
MKLQNKLISPSHCQHFFRYKPKSYVPGRRTILRRESTFSTCCYQSSQHLQSIWLDEHDQKEQDLLACQIAKRYISHTWQQSFHFFSHQEFAIFKVHTYTPHNCFLTRVYMPEDHCSTSLFSLLLGRQKAQSACNLLISLFHVKLNPHGSLKISMYCSYYV